MVSSIRMPSPLLPDLEYYTLAAKKCFITRQAMRQSVQTLEQAFNVRLVENRQNYLSLTSAGKQLYESAKPVLKSWNELGREMTHPEIPFQTELLTADDWKMGNLMPGFW